jgi:hypothetical protein
MATGNDFSDWMSASGCRRQPCRRASQVADSRVRTVVADGPGPAQQTPAAPTKRLASRGPIDRIEFSRGLALLGILGGTLWIEWLAIKSLAAYCSQFFGG